MNFDLNALLMAFVPLFVAIDAPGVIPFFIALTCDLEPARVRKIIGQSVLVALVLGLVFVFIGKQIFQFLGITTPDFMVAGGTLLFAISLRDLLSQEEKHRTKTAEFAVVPLGTPLIAGPAVLTTLILLTDLHGPAVTLTSYVVNLAIAGLIFLNSFHLQRLLGKQGMRAFSKVSSLFLAAIAVMLVRKGLAMIIAGQ